MVQVNVKLVQKLVVAVHVVSMSLKLWQPFSRQGIKIKLHLQQDEKGGCHQPARLALWLFLASTALLVDITL